MIRAQVRHDIAEKVLREHDRQDEIWGFPQHNSFAEWGCILGEEAGELIKELCDLQFGRGDVDRMIEEAVQTAAVAVSIIEHCGAEVVEL